MSHRRLILIFTRDFNQWVNQLARDQYVHEFPKLWGKSLEDQIIIYDGKSSMWWRYEDDMAKLKAYMTSKPLNHYIFQEAPHKGFRKNIDQVRKLISVPQTEIKDNADHLQKITDLMTKEYSLYALGVFLPGPWREDFLAKHSKEKKKAQAVIDRAFKSREHSEGILKELGDYMRVWLGPLLKKQHYSPAFVKLLSMQETKKFLERGKLPAKSELTKRAKGFVSFKGKIYLTTTPKLFFKKRGIEMAEPNTQGVHHLSGMPAFSKGIVRGKVQLVYNSEDSKKFKSGNILVTPMTAPDYLLAMKKAKAIVTDEGGLTCHAAITARELKLPTVIGTKLATKIFKNGDIIEVDTKQGVIKKLH